MAGISSPYFLPGTSPSFSVAIQFSLIKNCIPTRIAYDGSVTYSILLSFWFLCLIRLFLRKLQLFSDDEGMQARGRITVKGISSLSGIFGQWKKTETKIWPLCQCPTDQMSCSVCRGGSVLESSPYAIWMP